MTEPSSKHAIPKGYAFQRFSQQRRDAEQKIEQTLKNHRIKGQKVGLLVMLLLAIGIYWTSVTKLDEVAIAQGMVIPAEKITVIQHLEGGILDGILIVEGDVISAGQTLFHLDLGVGGMDRDRLVIELESLLISRHRANSEANEKQDIQYSAKQKQDFSDIVLAEEQIFHSNRRVLKSSIKIFDSQLSQKKTAQDEIIDRVKNLQIQLKGVKELHDILKLQFQSGSASKTDVLQAALKITDTEGKISQGKQSLNRVKEEIYEVTLAKEQEREKFRIRALFDLEEAEEKIATIRRSLERASAQQNRAAVISPIDGVVKSLRYTSIGNVVQPGEILAEIVPVGNNLLIEAKLKPMDRGFIEVGQEAKIKIDTFEFSRYGGIDGTVALVSASSTTSQDGQTFFNIHIKPEKTYLGETENDLAISSGMQATVDIKTGTRTVLDFLLKPILKIRDEAFRER